MRNYFYKLPLSPVFILLALFFSFAQTGFTQDEPLQIVEKNTSPKGSIINLKDADIRAFIEDVSVLTGKTFIIDPRVNGTISINSQSHLNKAQVFSVFLEALRVRGFTAVPTGRGVYRISLIQGASQHAPLAGSRQQPGIFVTEIIKLEYSDASRLVPMIRPVMHTQGRLTAIPGGRIVVITDYPENIAKAKKIISAYDVDHTIVQTIPLKNIDATQAKDIIAELIKAGTKNTLGRSVNIVAVDTSNSLILRGDKNQIAELENIIRQMDIQSQKQRGMVSVMGLRYADGANILKILERILPSYKSKSEGDIEPGIAYEPTSNSLIINAEPDVQQALEYIVRQLDVRRPQVLVEAIIVEISDNTAEDLGLQFLLAGNEDSAFPLISTNYSRTAPNLLAIAGALAGNVTTGTDAQSAAVSQLLGLTGGAVGLGGRGNSGLFGAILTAVRNDTNSNVLSTPFLTTMDNQPASFNVGQEVPFITGQTLGNNNQNPFQTIERQKVGITLSVTPQISDGDVIRLDIKQTVDSISRDAAALASDLITNTRSIETVVLANDGDIIVLGGLIQSDEQLQESKVPILGDIPAVGNLFRSHNNTNKQTNLMVFIRPTIIRNGEDARPLTEQKLDIIRRLEQAKSPGEASRIDKALQDLAKKEKNR